MATQSEPRNVKVFITDTRERRNDDVRLLVGVSY